MDVDAADVAGAADDDLGDAALIIGRLRARQRAHRRVATGGCSVGASREIFAILEARFAELRSEIDEARQYPQTSNGNRLLGG